MRDIIWTVIIVWLIYKVVAVFKNSSSKRSTEEPQTHHQTSAHRAPKEQDIKSAVQKHLNKEGEYVDFEEVK